MPFAYDQIASGKVPRSMIVLLARFRRLINRAAALAIAAHAQQFTRLMLHSNPDGALRGVFFCVQIALRHVLFG